jgi:serine/threonine protein kinase
MDVYSLAATMFFLLTGKQPFSGNAAYEIYPQKKVAFAGVKDLPDDVPGKIRRTLVSALSPKSKDRPQTMHEFGRLLSNVLEEDALKKRINLLPFMP